MKESVVVYEKQFSNLEGIQNAQKIQYIMISNHKGNNTVYGIEVNGQEEHSEKKSDRITEISYSKEHVLALITFLYENAVPVESAKEIIYNMI